jgi:hypothetical protein
MLSPNQPVVSQSLTDGQSVESQWFLSHYRLVLQLWYHSGGSFHKCRNMLSLNPLTHFLSQSLTVIHEPISGFSVLHILYLVLQLWYHSGGSFHKCQKMLLHPQFSGFSVSR